MRVALVCPYSWTAQGGVQSHIRGLARSLRSRGIDAHVITPADGPVEAGPIHVVGRTVPLRANGSIVPVAMSPGSVRRTLAILRRGRFDVVHVHEPLCPALSMATLLFDTGSPLVGTFHRYSDEPGLYRTFGPFCRWASSRLDVRIAVSEAARWHVERAVPGDYTVVPNGIDVGPEPPARPAGGGPARVVFVGRPDRRKGLPVLLEAFARLPGSPTLDLIGVEPATLRDAGGRLPLDRVRAHGRVDDRRRDELLREADVFCAPALWGESFSIVVAEAMAAGLPVVASKVGGIPELVRSDAGIIVPPGDVAATASALERLLARPAERRDAGRVARERARGLDWSLVTDRVLDLYGEARERRALGEGRPARPGGGGPLDGLPPLNRRSRRAGRPRAAMPAPEGQGIGR